MIKSICTSVYILTFVRRWMAACAIPLIFVLSLLFFATYNALQVYLDDILEGMIIKTHTSTVATLC